MDKKAQELLTASRTLVSEQREKLADVNKVIGNLNKYKLAFDILNNMSDMDQLDPSDFQDSFQNLLEKSAEDLSERAKILSVVDVSQDLGLGDLDQRKEANEPVFGDSAVSPTPHSATSEEAARQLINNTLGEG